MNSIEIVFSQRVLRCCYDAIVFFMGCRHAAEALLVTARENISLTKKLTFHTKTVTCFYI